MAIAGGAVKPEYTRTAMWVAGAAACLALAALAFPRAALTLIGVLVGVVLAGLTVAIISRIWRDVERPDRSPFTARSKPDPPQLPQELRLLVLQTDDLRRSRTVTNSLEWRVQRIATRRLSARHGLHHRRTDHHPAIAAVVSPQLYRIIVADRENTALPAPAFAQLLDELESL